MSLKKSVLVIITLITGLIIIGKVIAEDDGNISVSSHVEEAKRTFTAYYFYGNFRCANCKKIEQYSREAIERYFTEELKLKRLVYNTINTDMPENRHFIEDYQLYTKSLIIAEFRNGKQVRWKNLAKVWNYLNDKDKFYEYVKSEIQNYLEHI